MQTDGLRSPVIKDGKRVAIADADHSASELQGFDHTDEPEG
jgi:hypothetical protein